jgi:protein-L-isoaspartate(D-aspartate) O-methyltransferase
MSKQKKDQDHDGPFQEMRERMVEHQLRGRGVLDETVLAAMERVPREAFVPYELRERAYADGPLPIGLEQTISQPFVVAAMSEALAMCPGQRVLEVGTGSGYQTAVLAEMGLQVYTVERIGALAMQAESLIKQLGYEMVKVTCADGYDGWEEEAPFDGILVTAAAPELPSILIDQLKPGGRLVIPIGRFSQDLRVYRKHGDGTAGYKELFPVRFVPLLPGTT